MEGVAKKAATAARMASTAQRGLDSANQGIDAMRRGDVGEAFKQAKNVGGDAKTFATDVKSVRKQKQIERNKKKTK